METNRQRKSKPARKPNENNLPASAADSNQASVKGKTKAKKPPPLQPSAEIQVPLPLQKPSLSRKNAGANWNSVLAAVSAATDGESQQLVNGDGEDNNNNNNSEEAPKKSRNRRNRQPKTSVVAMDCEMVGSEPLDKPADNTDNTNNSKEAPKMSRNHRKRQRRNNVVAMDCEMVGTGPLGKDDMLARVSIVDKNGEVLMDKFVKPKKIVTDYRTSVSGIRAKDIEHAEDFEKVQDEVVEFLQGKILVGHGLQNDLAVLFIKHPYVNIRDTARYKPLARLVSNGQTPSLKRISKAILGIDIQKGEHNSVEDARAAMSIYKRLSADWEKYIKATSRSK